MQDRAKGRQLIIIGIVVMVLVVGVGFFLANRGGGSSNGSPAAQASGSQPEVVALQSIPQGTIFKSGQPLDSYFGVKQAPSNLVPFGAYSSVSQIAALTHSPGCGAVQTNGCQGEITVSQTIYQNSPVVAGMISQLGQYRQSVGPSFAVPYGYVAQAVSLTPVNAVYGSISPGDDVDLIASYDPQAERNDPFNRRVTQFVLNDIRVISVDSPPSTGSSSSSGSGTTPSSSSSSTSGQLTQTTLILLVKYQQALIIQHLKDFNWLLSVVLRSAKETDVLHFRTSPVTNRWYFKNPNSFVPVPGF